MPIIDVVEVRFKNGRKEYFRNTENLQLYMGDVVATEASPGHDIGTVTLTGELVRTQLKKRKLSENDAFPKVYRKASQRDLDVWQEMRNREEHVKKRAREWAIELKLEMKISDVEFQGDGSKVIFYYTANERVDFRQLIKEYAKEFGVRIEMKQIGFRQEAARLGGIGSCGRELCCSTWLTDFRSVNTSAARYQQLSLNPQKLAGQCGKLKCCLNYELDSYLDALKSFPKLDTKLKTKNGVLTCQKIDIFKQIMWFSEPKMGAQWHQLSVENVHKIIELNKQDKFPEEIGDFVVEDQSKNESLVIEEDNLSRFDQPKKKSKKRPNNRRKNTNNRPKRANEGQQKQPSQNANQGKPKRSRSASNKNRRRPNNNGNKRNDSSSNSKE